MNTKNAMPRCLKYFSFTLLTMFLFFSQTKTSLAQTIPLLETQPIFNPVPIPTTFDPNAETTVDLPEIFVEQFIEKIPAQDPVKLDETVPEQINEDATQQLPPKNPPKITTEKKTVPAVVPKKKIIDAPSPHIYKKDSAGRLVCAKKNDKPSKSVQHKKKHMDMECCLDPDETPNPHCYYGAAKYQKLLKKFQ